MNINESQARALSDIRTEAKQCESGILGICLVSQDCATVIANGEDGKLFTGTNRKVFDVIKRFVFENTPVDIITVGTELREDSAHVAKLTSGATPSLFEFQVKRLRELRAREQLFYSGIELCEQVIKRSESVQKIIEKNTQSMVSITLEDKTTELHNSSDLSMAVMKRYERAKAGDLPKKIKTGISDLDAITEGFACGDFVLIGARPSIGKTAVATTAIGHQVWSGLNVGMFTIEMPEISITNRIISGHAGISLRRIETGLCNPGEETRYFNQCIELGGKKLIVDDTPHIKLSELKKKARLMVMKHAIEIIWIDYIGIIDYDGGNYERRNEQVSQISIEIKALARELNIPIVTLVQVGRQTENKPPTLSDLNDTKQLEQDSDIVIFLHRERTKDRDVKYVDTQFDVAKNRNGPTGICHAYFEPRCTRFVNKER